MAPWPTNSTNRLVIFVALERIRDIQYFMYALIDCNNFFVSCERAFQPALENKPVVVLSSNDGCVISRSAEVKKMGVPMGAPYFEYREALTKAGVRVLSSNFSLYGDISARVMATIKAVVGKLEIYSIDEAFLDLTDAPDPLALAHHLKKTIRQWTRIPVSVGLAPTKVLAKVANHSAKKNPAHGGVFQIHSSAIDEHLRDLPVGELWGIGRAHARTLWEKRVNTALELKNCSNEWLRKLLSIHGVQIAEELRGRPCFNLESDPLAKKGITCSRSFGKPITDRATLQKAVIGFVARAAEKLREQGSVASELSVFARTSQFKLGKKYIGSAARALPIRTSFTPLLIATANALVAELYQAGHVYAKAGVHLSGLIGEENIQQNLFLPVATDKQRRLMRSMDKLNHTFGSGTITFAISGSRHAWDAKAQFRSPCFTSSWSQLPRAT